MDTDYNIEPFLLIKQIEMQCLLNNRRTREIKAILDEIYLITILYEKGLLQKNHNSLHPYSKKDIRGL